MDLTAAGNALKTMFEDPISDQVVAKADCLDWFEQNANVKQSDFGQYIEVSSIYGDPEGVGARSENDYIPVALDPLFLKQQIYLKYLYGTVQLTKQTMQQMRKGRAAFISWSDSTLKKLERAIRQDVDRQLYGFGAGIIARVNDGSPDATLGVDSGFGVAGVANAAQLFRVGARYRFFADAAAATEHNTGLSSAKCASIDRANQIVTFESGATDIPTDTANNDYIMRGDAAGHSGQNSGVDREIMGMLGHIDDGNILASYFGQSRSSYSFLQSTVIDGSASPYDGNLTETLLMYANDEVMQYGNGDPDAALTTRGVLRNYFQQLKADRSFNDPRSYTGGPGRGLSVNLGDKTITLRAGRQAPEGTLFMLDRSTLVRAHNTGWEWDDTTGSVFKQVTDGTGRKDEFYAYGRWFMQTFCKAPQQNARINNLSESVA